MSEIWLWAFFVLAVFAVLSYQEWDLRRETNEIFDSMSRTTCCIGALIDELYEKDAKQRKQIALLQRRYERERKKRLIRSYKLAQNRSTGGCAVDPVALMSYDGEEARRQRKGQASGTYALRQYRETIKRCRSKPAYPLP